MGGLGTGRYLLGFLSKLLQDYPELHLEDKVSFQEVGNIRPRKTIDIKEGKKKLTRLLILAREAIRKKHYKLIRGGTRIQEMKKWLNNCRKKKNRIC